MFQRYIDWMKRDWNDRAEDNAMFWIATLGKDKFDWNIEEFFKTGERDVDRFTTDFFHTINFDPSDKSMLEIGCGVGRMTRAFAKRFKEVYGTDVSEVMISKARSIPGLGQNIHLQVGNGVDLNHYKSNFFDFCFSYIVFQHVPAEKIILRYVKEIGRVLKADGFFKFQVRNEDDRKIRWYQKYRIRWVHTDKIPILKRRLALKIRRYNTFSGVYVSKEKLMRVLRDSNLVLIDIAGEGSQYMWVSGQKNRI